MDQNELRENLIKSLGLESLKEDEQNAMIEKIGGLLQKRIILRVVELLDQNSQNEFEKLLSDTEGKEDQEEKITAFLSQKISNMDKVVNEEVEKIREEVKGDLEVLQK